MSRSEAEREARRAPVLVVFSGPSGVGKDTVITAVKDSGFDIYHVVTATTRLPRECEVDGREYHFVNAAEFSRMIRDHELLEHADVHGNRYGTPIAEVSHAFEAEQDALLKIDVQGGLQVKRRIPQAVFVFLAPPTPEDLVHRLRARKTESDEELNRRTADAHFELEQRNAYDYVIVNRADDVSAAAHQLKSIITAERLRIHRQPIDLATVRQSL